MNFSITPNFQMKFLQLTHFNSVENTIKIRDYLRRFFFFFLPVSKSQRLVYISDRVNNEEREGRESSCIPSWMGSGQSFGGRRFE